MILSLPFSLQGVTFIGLCHTVWSSAHRVHAVLRDCSQQWSAIKVNDSDLTAKAITLRGGGRGAGG